MENRGGESSIERKEVMMVFFDLPMETGTQRKAYRGFRKFLKSSGYMFFQKSVYLRLMRNGRNSNDESERVKKAFPPGGSISILPLGVAAFERMVMAGETKLDFGKFLDDVVFI